MELYLIRHAQSYNNALTDITQRVQDPALTALGQRQAQLMAAHLAEGMHVEQKVGQSEEDTKTEHLDGYDIDRLYCSAMRRSLQTARPIGEALGLTPEVWLDIHEHGGIFLDHGENGGVKGYPGLTRSEILAEFPNSILPAGITEAGWWTGGFEDWPGCHARAIRVAHQLHQMAKKADPHETLAMVSHGGFLDALIKALCHMLPNQTVFFHHYNTAITHIDFRANGSLHIRYLNRVPHLEAELVS